MNICVQCSVLIYDYHIILCYLCQLNTVSRRGALPGLISESIAYLSTGEILNEGTQSEVGEVAGEMAEDSELSHMNSDLSLSDTPHNPSGMKRYIQVYTYPPFSCISNT